MLEDFDKSFESYMDGEQEITPEEAFSMVTIIPKKKVKLTAYLEDKDGERILLATVATNLNKYIRKHLKSKENTPVNSQLLPLINQYMVSSIGRHIGLRSAGLLLSAEMPKYAISTFGLDVALLMRYIQQHSLKIITEETPVTQIEIDKYLSMQDEANEKMLQAMMGGSDGSDD